MANLGWAKFQAKHFSPYTALIAVRAKQVKPCTPASAVQAIIHGHATADWATVSSRTLGKCLNANRSTGTAPVKLTPKGVSAIVVCFETKADFDALKQALNGKPWQSVVVNAVDGFGATIP
jgi:hypothetical protein